MPRVQNVDGLKRLALARCWKQAITLCEHCIYNLPLLPHESLQWQFALAFSLVKLERPGEAAGLLSTCVKGSRSRGLHYFVFFALEEGILAQTILLWTGGGQDFNCRVI